MTEQLPGGRCRRSAVVCLAFVRCVGRDIDQRLDRGQAGAGVGDDAATVRVPGQDDRTIEGGDERAEVLAVAGDSAERVRRSVDLIAATAERTEDIRPAGRVRERSVNQDDGGLALNRGVPQIFVRVAGVLSACGAAGGESMVRVTRNMPLRCPCGHLRCPGCFAAGGAPCVLPGIRRPGGPASALDLSRQEPVAVQRLLAPAVDRAQVVGTGGNYADHAAEARTGGLVVAEPAFMPYLWAP